MHPNHKIPLDVARLVFRLARRKMNKEVKGMNVLREYMMHLYLEDDHRAVSILRVQMRIVLAAIESYQAAGENLVIVERLLEKA